MSAELGIYLEQKQEENTEQQLKNRNIEKRILIVDDEPDITIALKKVLGMSWFTNK